MMFDDDDDGVQPEFKAVHEYYFEVAKDKHVCFSILPFQFDENDKVGDCDSEKKVYLRGVMDKSLYPVHKQVVAWRVGLDCEQPNISVLSSEGNWIKLLDPWKCYKDEIARSILITVQMLHFLRKHHRDKRSLWDHLNEVFDKLSTKPSIDDLRKHHPLIKLFQERDPAFMKLKILHRFIGDITKTTKEPRASVTKVQFTGNDETHGRNNDTDSDCGDDGNDDHSDYGDCNSDGDTNNDDGTDTLCAFCDDGGKLLSCIGQCKRSFHPRKEDGWESKCKTLGYTYAQLKEIDSYLCKNCEYKEHQCFKCGELEPSAGPNAKVFKCNNPTCGHFYHPKCVAKLLEPDDSVGSCELAKRIRTGMSFTCPVHWCFECRRMEEKTQRAMQFAVCRRCPKSYHRECLPREISFESKDKDTKQRAWKLSGIIIIYCLDHKICKPTGNAERGHIKFPHTPKISKVGGLAKKKGKLAGKRKRSIGQCSKKSTKVLNRLPREKIEQTQNSLEHMVLEPEYSTMNLKEDLQIEPSSAVDRKTKERKTSGRKKERSSSTSCDIAKKCADRSVQDNLMDNPPADRDAELDNEICRIPEDKDGNGKEKSSTEKATNKAISNENNEPNGVLCKNFVDIHTEADQSEFKSRAERSIELGENADGHDSILGQEISMGENQTCRNLREQELRSGKRKNASNKSAKFGLGNGVMTPDHDDDNPPEKLLHVPHVDKMTIIDRQHTQPEYGHDKGREGKASHAFQEEPNNEQNRVLDKIFVDIHTEVDQSKFKTRAERSMELGENADGDVSISGQEISMGENQMCRSLCEQESRSGNGKNGSNESAKSGLGDGRVTPDQPDDNPPEKLLHVPHVDKITITVRNGGVTPDQPDDNPPEKLLHVHHVDKITITDRKHPHSEYGCDKDQEVNASHAFQEEPNSSRYDVNRKAMAIDTSGDKSRKRRKLKEKAADGNNTDLDKKERCNHIEDSGPSGSQCHDENGAAEVSEYKSRQSTGLNRREILTHITKENSSNSKMPRNSWEKPRKHSPNRQTHVTKENPSNSKMPRNSREEPRKHSPNRQTHITKENSSNSKMPRNSREKPREHSPNRQTHVTKENSSNSKMPRNSREEPRKHSQNRQTHITKENSSNSKMPRNSREKPREHSPNRQRTYRDMYEQHPATNEHHPSYRNYDPRSHDPLQPVFAPSDFDANGCYDDPRLYMREAEHDIPGWHSPRFHPGNHEYFTSGRHGPPYHPARPEDVDYSRDVNSLPFQGYDERGNFMHGEHRAMGFDPASIYSIYSPHHVSNNGTYQPHPGRAVPGGGAGGRPPWAPKCKGPPRNAVAPALLASQNGMS